MSQPTPLQTPESNIASGVFQALLSKCKNERVVGKKLCLLLDYDGTLTPIVQRPELAQLDAAGLSRLKRLSQHPQVHLALISGRSVEQLQGFLQSILPAPLLLCGLHGGQVWEADKGTWLQKPDDTLMQAKDVFQGIVLDTIAHPQGEILPLGVSIEEKGYSFAVHYRLADEETGKRIHGQIEALFAHSEAAQAHFRLQSGHQVIEIVPKTFNKGAGVQFCLNHWGVTSDNSLALFAGDDKTDEIGIQATLHAGGEGIAIGVLPSEMQQLSVQEQAQVLCLPTPEVLHYFMEALLED
jgi:trehalose 6-phosphate phosphatase